MPAKFSVIPPQRTDEVLRFLAGVFGTTETPANFAPETLAWKFFEPHPWWPTGRSYVLETEGGIAAHGCAAPVRFVVGDAVLDSAVIFDWASGKLLPGAGLLIWRHCAQLTDGPLLAIGGTSQAQRVTSQVKWFVPKEDLRWYARPMKPWKRFLRSPRSLRDFLKLGRNIWWSRVPSLPSAKGWSCRPARPEDPVFTPAGDFVPILRTRPWIDYLAACPIANCTLWILECGGEARGHALVANLGGSARVADFALGGKQGQDAMTSAFSALLRALQSQSDILEVVAGSSLDEDTRAFTRCGLRDRASDRVLSADLHKAFPPDARLQIVPVLNDAYYLYDPANPFSL